jgi:hypothetical protein
MDKEIKEIVDKLGHYGEFLGARDLVDLGLFTSVQTLYRARIYKDAPEYVKIGRFTVYSKISVLKYLETYYQIILRRLKKRKLHLDRKIHKITKSEENPNVRSIKSHLVDVVIKALEDCKI